MIVLDAGHGGQDVGLQSSEGQLREKEWTLRFVLLLGQTLSADPRLRVVYVRQEDVTLDLDSRAEKANQAKADLAISIHLGAAPPGLGGPRVYFYAFPPKMAASDGVGEAGPSRLPPGLRPWAEAQRPYSAASNDIAAHLQADLNALYGAGGQVRSANLYQLKRSALPAILIECGSLQAAADRERLAQEEFLRQLAQTLRHALLRSFYPMAK